MPNPKRSTPLPKWTAGLDVRTASMLVAAGFRSKVNVTNALKNNYFIRGIGEYRKGLIANWLGLNLPATSEPLEVRRAILLLRKYGYAVSKASFNDQGNMADDQVCCIHCMGSKTDPCDDNEKKCYLCGGTGRITESLKQKTIAEAEAPGNPSVFSI